MKRRALLAALALCWASPVFAQSGPAKAPPLAIKGYDPVSYFNPGKPARGASTISLDFDDSRYLFASQKNKDLFSASPDKYAPQFTGLCATGLSMGMKHEADPNVFLVRDGKLYVFASTERRGMAQNDPSLLTKAHQAWDTTRK
jgi:YHS domain-containing protein